uniref:Uncharacterized protein n=1 Tax=Caenorhabditis japonica TaxID=281687 RepID=A0A8R1ECV5_CAEJA
MWRENEREGNLASGRGCASCAPRIFLTSKHTFRFISDHFVEDDEAYYHIFLFSKDYNLYFFEIFIDIIIVH